jgi:hypothetical protein
MKCNLSLVVFILRYLAILLRNFARVFLALEEYDKAISYCERSLAMLQDGNANPLRFGNRFSLSFSSFLLCCP